MTALLQRVEPDQAAEYGLCESSVQGYFGFNVGMPELGAETWKPRKLGWEDHQKKDPKSSWREVNHLGYRTAHEAKFESRGALACTLKQSVLKTTSPTTLKKSSQKDS